MCAIESILEGLASALGAFFKSEMDASTTMYLLIIGLTLYNV